MLSDRIIADIRDREGWAGARENKIGASDAAAYAKLESVPSYTRAKLMPPWMGSANSEWGNQREAVILNDFGYEQNHFCFQHAEFPRHVATPDGIRLGPKPRLAQVKTTIKDFISKRTGDVLIPPNYRRQVWWEQWVAGPEFEETDFLYERYRKVGGQFVPDLEAKRYVIVRDDAEIAKLVRIANEVLRHLDLSRI